MGFCALNGLFWVSAAGWVGGMAMAPPAARGDGARQGHGEASREGAMTPAHRDATTEASSLLSRCDRASPRAPGARITKTRVIASMRWLEHNARTALAARVSVPVAGHVN